MRTRTKAASGFSLIELMIVVTIVLVVLAMVLPLLNQTLRTYRASSDARNIAAQLAMARMRAANKFTRARLNMVGANAYRVEIETNRGACGTSTWAADGGTITLQQQVSFGFSTVTVPAPPQTVPIAQPANNSAAVNFTTAGDFYGAIISSTYHPTSYVNLHYDRSLMNGAGAVGNYHVTSFAWSRF